MENWKLIKICSISDHYHEQHKKLYYLVLNVQLLVQQVLFFKSFIINRRGIKYLRNSSVYSKM